MAIANDIVKFFYEKPDGTFDICAAKQIDKVKIDQMVQLLVKLKVHSKFNRQALIGVWKQFDKINVRMYSGGK